MAKVTQSFTVPGRLPGLNEMIGALNSRSRHKFNNLKKSTQQTIALEAMSQKLQNITTPAHIIIDWHEPNRRRDNDNIAAGIKFILDALVNGKWLPNDGKKHIPSFDHRFHVDKDDPRVVVTIKEGMQCQN